MAGVRTDTLLIEGLSQGEGVSRFLEPFRVFKGKLSAAAARDAFVDAVDLRALGARFEAEIRPRAGELGFEIVGHALSRHGELGLLFARLGQGSDTGYGEFQ
ncbi:uncharacterized protein THITE_2130380 [Thermothielavioides terrestris NRRL 8126]|uniref:Uncharacterized protein n=1 Tax=Thermothielavioides terrestris (strain ATCC 38088 / NRRL 8126) TaxID=578455 RepID=G2R9B9_THETT|nr:uncharacterized protein THITE_2130380 [Thermothielavioides terrestris NRRL 8126]AEO68660.1 hypothetical protein THITE_2130380 [Thermothielavioides terrestris NRRL 8126]